MANREQRRAGKKLMKRPELKGYVEKFCMEISSVMIDHCEQAKISSEVTGQPMDFQSIQNKVEELMKQKGTELGNKVQEIVKSHKPSTVRTNIRASKVH